MDDYDKLREQADRMRAAERAKVVEDWKAANGYEDLLKAYAGANATIDTLRGRVAELEAKAAAFDRIEEATRNGCMAVTVGVIAINEARKLDAARKADHGA